MMMMMMLLFISCTAESCSIQLYLILIILFILELIASSFHLLDILRTYHQFLHRLHQKWTFHLDVCRWIYLFYFSVEISLYVLLSFQQISILNSYYLFMPLHRKIIFLLPTRMDIHWVETLSCSLVVHEWVEHYLAPRSHSVDNNKLLTFLLLNLSVTPGYSAWRCSGSPLTRAKLILFNWPARLQLSCQHILFPFILDLSLPQHCCPGHSFSICLYFLQFFAPVLYVTIYCWFCNV